MESDILDFPPSFHFIGYVRQIAIHGDTMWALMDSDGEPVCISANRSAPYFFAADHEITVVQRH